MRILLISLAVALCSCSQSRPPALQPYPDPVQQSYAGKGVKYFSRSYPDPHGQQYSPDSIVVDSAGRVTYYDFFWERGRYQYDSLNFKLKNLIADDAMGVKEIYRYTREPDVLIAEVDTPAVFVGYDHLTSLDTCLTGHYKNVYYHLDELGRVRLEVDSVYGRCWLFSYNVDGALKRTGIFVVPSGELLDVKTYYYTANGLLDYYEDCEVGFDLNTQEIHYFNKGVRDSSVSTTQHLPGVFVTKYHHVFH